MYEPKNSSDGPQLPPLDVSNVKMYCMVIYLVHPRGILNRDILHFLQMSIHIGASAMDTEGSCHLRGISARFGRDSSKLEKLLLKTGYMSICCSFPLPLRKVCLFQILAASLSNLP